MSAARYNGLTQALHWLTVGALCLLLPFVWVAENFPPGPIRTFWYMAHESMGISVLLLVVIRLTWRWRHRAPPYPARMSKVAVWIANVNHGLLYAVLMIMPITGYLMAGNGQEVSWFRLFNLPGFAHNEALGLAADWLHVTGQFALYTLVGLHVAAAVWHVAVLRDGMLERMLPEQDRQAP